MEKSKNYLMTGNFRFSEDNFHYMEIMEALEIAYLEGQISSLWKLHASIPGPLGVYDLMRITAQDLEQDLKDLLDE